ncbi:MAG: polyprenyl synthetase family protein [Alphaproteobacteria bacterium]|nr:polyprenyl synthetase family protein [Alphaproteobacteria bacterium]
MNNVDLEVVLRHVGRDVDRVLADIIPTHEGLEGRLFEAMRYATLSGGKRLRPFLVVVSSELFAVSRERALRVGAAAEIVHCYSLVHDDLPCMDDDDLRRGRPTTHVQFDEATAVLAGDALLTLAFEVLSDPATHELGEVRAELVHRLAVAAGGLGMAGGQMIDLLGEEQELLPAQITRMESMKTGALIGFCCEAGGILGGAASPLRAALHGYAHDIGLAYQIVDDLLDLEGDPVAMGKRVHKDAAAGKATLVRVLGVERARQHAEMLASQAIHHLQPFGEQARLLRAVAGFVINRRA